MRKKKEGFLLLAAAAVVFVIDLFTDSLSLFLYGMIAILCVYYFFSKGSYFYICPDCMSEFDDLK